MIYGENNPALLNYYVGEARITQAVFLFMRKNGKSIAGVQKIIASMGEKGKVMYEYKKNIMHFKEFLFNLDVPGEWHQVIFSQLKLV